ncbi:bacteriohemerythrin [Azospirillum thermophilum]|uniref:Hemerythrin-like metal-binding protein n=1 Tax=Azospirillum thermophilum TaxID=2202148 RepID=A0A2S2CQQ5_9PROT|nr:hemerythrin family protein [Azospirillum thermophilum]AWK86700.1 hemerythrin-like metal-binding protein [Azospirillum thermophilum]
MLEWRDAMALDNGGLDRDHQEEIALIRRFLVLPAGEEGRPLASAVLEELRDHSRRHFLREEKVQAAIGYPHLAEHRAQHRRLCVLLDEIMEQVQAGESAFSFGYVKQKADQLLPFWFLDHFAKADLRMKLHIAKAQLSPRNGQGQGRDAVR